MKFFPCALLCFLIACGSHQQQKNVETTVQKEDTPITQNTSNSNYTAEKKVVSDLPIKPPPEVKNPSGIYQAVLHDGPGKMQQTVAFYNDKTYRMQESYSAGKKDSVMAIDGMWSVSDGYIWLYKDQVLLARYKWKGDTLQYFDPVSKKNTSMAGMKDALQNEALANKKKQGVILFGLGNEPFWNVELNNKDSVSFRIADWSEPLKLKIDSTARDKDSLFYMAKNDSVQLKLTVLPYFCSDGMSDNVYQNKVQLVYNHQMYKGCGILYK